MKVEIWSDVMCPFCYIGKRRFEQALQRFAHADDIVVEWKSFQLDPNMQTQPGKNINQYLAERKGWSLTQAQQMNAHVTNMAADEGLVYNFDKAVVANSFDAHRFASFAKERGFGNQAEEALFEAYFTKGENIADQETLAQLGEEIGLDGFLIKKALAAGDYVGNVKNDLAEAEAIGVSGVPFFVLNRQYAVSGAQPVDVFLSALEKSFDEWRRQNPFREQVTQTSGEVCTPGNVCG